MHDERPYIPPWRRRATAADLFPEAAAAERQRLEAQRREARPAPERQPEPEGEDELDEPTPGEELRVKEAVRAHRGR